MKTEKGKRQKAKGKRQKSLGWLRHFLLKTAKPTLSLLPFAFCFLPFAFFFISPAWGSSTVAWEMTSYQDFVRGRFTGVSLTRDGWLKLAPKLDTVYASEQPVIWSMAQAADGTIYAGTGHRGRLLRIDKGGKGTVLWTADQPEVFAVALDPHGVLYAATSPKGKVYRIEGGKATEYFAPDARYIWALAFAPDGTLYVAGGDPGRIYRVEGPHKGEVYYETGQAHVTCLALDSEGRLLAGSEPNGILYRISAKDKAFVLYDASLAEIHTIIPMPDGTIYAAAMGSSLLRRAQSSQASQTASFGVTVTAPAASVTVTEDNEQAGLDIKPKPEPKPGQAAAPQVTTYTPSVDISGLDRSALYEIHPDNTVNTLWSSKEESIYDVLKADGHLIFSTDGHGRIYQLNPERKVTLLVQTNEGEATRLLLSPDGVVASTGDMGKILRLGRETGSGGSYEAPVHDAGTVARWGKLTWRGELCDGCGITFRTRSGNSARPDKTWSDWSQPLSDRDGSPIASPNARFIQWDAALTGKAGQSPSLDAVTLAYLPQNGAPVLKSVNVTSQFANVGGTKPAAQSSTTAAYSITVTDSGDSSSGPAGTPTQTLSRSSTRQIQVTWQAEDPDNDRLVYALYYRGEDEREWKLLKDNLQENTYIIDSDVLADGKYFFKVTASDRPSNPPATARQAELVSAPVLIDNTPPVITAGAVNRSGSDLEVSFEAVDAASPLRRFEYSLDAGSWIPMEPITGIIDSQREQFRLRLQNLSPGEHVVVVRATDANNNVGLAKVVVR